MTAPDGLGTAMTAVYASGARGTECALLVALVHSGDWSNPSGETGIDAPTLAARVGAAVSTVRDALGALRDAGVLVERSRPGRSTARRIEWSALAEYVTPNNRPAPIRTSEPSDVRTPPVVGGVPLRTSEATPPVVGGAPPVVGGFSSSSPPSLLSGSAEGTLGTHAEPTSRPPDGSTDPSGTLPLPVATPAIPAGPADDDREGNAPGRTSVAAHASAPRGGRAAPGGASGIPDDVLAAYAELDPERAASIRAGGHVGIASAIAKAASKPTARGGGVGSERLAARLRYIARNPGDPTVRAWRERTGGEVSQVLRGSNGWTVPIDARVDDLAASGRAVVAAPPKPAAPIPAPPRSTAREDFEGMVIRFSRTACTAWLERTGRYPVPGALPPESRHVLAAVGGWEALAEAAGGDPAEAVALLMRAWDARGGTE